MEHSKRNPNSSEARGLLSRRHWYYPFSDIDIVCEMHDPGCSIVASCIYSRSIPIEIYRENRSISEQNDYVHMLVEAHLLKIHGSTLREEVIRLKNEGYKTEPAFAKALNISGDPYYELYQLKCYV